MKANRSAIEQNSYEKPIHDRGVITSQWVKNELVNGW